MKTMTESKKEKQHRLDSHFLLEIFVLVQSTLQIRWSACAVARPSPWK